MHQWAPWIPIVTLLLMPGAPPQEAGAPSNTSQSSSQKTESVNSLLLKNWDVATRGPLLVVDPNDANTVLAFTDAGLSFNRYDATEVPRSVRRVGEVNALVPQYTYAVNRNAKISPFLSLARAELWQLFETSLSESQISLLCGSEGLTTAALDDEQKQVLSVLLPNPLRVRELKGSSANYGDAANEFVVPDSDRNRVRLRMSLAANAYLPTAAVPAPGKSDRGVFVGFQTSAVNSEGGFSKYRIVEGASHADLFLKQTANRLKPSDLPYNSPALQTIVEMPPIQSVSQLVARIAQQTGVPMKADARVGKLRVAYVGPASRCSDLLEALALSVGGTYRRLPGDKPVYLLCHDVQGEAAYKFPVWNWYLTSSAERRAFLTSRLYQLADGRFANRLRLDKDTLFPMDSTTQSQIFQQVREGKPATTSVSAAQLPVGTQEIVRQTVSNYQAYQASTPVNQPPPSPIKASEVKITLSAKVVLEIPNVGPVEDPAAMSQPLRTFLTPTPAVAASTGLEALKQEPVACYVLAPDTDIKALSVLLSVPSTTDPKAPLLFDISSLLGGQSAATEKAREATQSLFQSLTQQGVKIFLVCSLYGESARYADEKTSPSGTLAVSDPVLDANALGMGSLSWQAWYSKNVLQVARPKTLADTSGMRWFTQRGSKLTLSRLRALAEPQGVEAIVLSDIAPNGYAVISAATPTPRSGTIEEIVGADFGYDNALRREFADKYDCDPIDLLPASLSRSPLNPRVPFFPEDVALARKWADFRAKKRADEVASRVSELRQSAPGKRVFVADLLYNDRASLISSPVVRERGLFDAPLLASDPGNPTPNSLSFLLFDEETYRDLITSDIGVKSQATLPLLAQYQATKPNTLFVAVRKHPARVEIAPQAK